MALNHMFFSSEIPDLIPGAAISITTMPAGEICFALLVMVTSNLLRAHSPMCPNLGSVTERYCNSVVIVLGFADNVLRDIIPRVTGGEFGDSKRHHGSVSPFPSFEHQQLWQNPCVMSLPSSLSHILHYSLLQECLSRLSAPLGWRNCQL